MADDETGPFYAADEQGVGIELKSSLLVAALIRVRLWSNPLLIEW